LCLFVCLVGWFSAPDIDPRASCMLGRWLAI
jgi:hypothetical protein